MFSLPLFPLPNVVLFPNVFLPLHIFEPRYKQMINDALAGDRIIGMALLKPGYEADYDGAPPVFPTGCSGVITHSERLDDGRFNIVLRGLDKFSIAGEEPSAGKGYRTARITRVDDAVEHGDRGELRILRAKVQQMLTPVLATALEGRLPDAMPDEDLINALAQYLEFDPIEKLALLEQPGPLARCRAMLELMEMKQMGTGDPGSGLVH